MNISDLYKEAKSYKMMLENQSIDQYEFKDLIESLKIADQIKENADEFSKNQEIRNYLMTLYNLASAISSL